ncbi:MAG: hypothetical protein HXY18_01735 [Bryobacteraceae bacterium]|nr:hypothetical protein [Bryobacteraceae bacterium]
MRTLAASLLWMLASRRRWDGRWSYRRAIRPIRPLSPIRSAFRFFWSLLWLGFGLAMAFSPEFRGMFVQFWAGFARILSRLVQKPGALSM